MMMLPWKPAPGCLASATSGFRFVFGVSVRSLTTRGFLGLIAQSTRAAPAWSGREGTEATQVEWTGLRVGVWVSVSLSGGN
jgi:hypothetical protein